MERSWKAENLHWKLWSEESIVYHSVSGCTHVLNATAAQVLKILENKPSTPSEISKELASRLGIEPDAEILQKVASLLRSLDALGLLESL